MRTMNSNISKPDNVCVHFRRYLTDLMKRKMQAEDVHDEKLASQSNYTYSSELSISEASEALHNSETASQKPKKPPRSERKRQKRAEKMALIKSRRREKKLNAKLNRRSKTERDSVGPESLEQSKHVESDDKTSSTPSDVGDSQTEHVSKRARLDAIRERCQVALTTGQRICIDCSLESHMTEKECSKLAQQIGRLYGSNRKVDKPAHIYLCGLNRDGFTYKECVRKNSGFDNYVMDVRENSVVDTFKRDDIVYLSPDSPNVLDTVDARKVYVIGGLIDESVKNHVTVNKAKELEIHTARLPIDEYMEKCQGRFSYNKILAVNQVFDILLTFTQTADWCQALSAGVPKRKGFIVKN